MQKRNTLQRSLVFEALNLLRTHPTAEDVYKQVIKKYGGISLATVYRNLNSLADDGLIKKISVPEAADRFDFRNDEHYHLSCRACGSFEDAPIERVTGLADNVREKSGFLVEGYDIVFVGLCGHCRETRSDTEN